MKLSNLLEFLHKLEWKHCVLEDEAGGVIVILERGGRILGVYPNKHSDNMLWVCPDISDYKQALDKYEVNSHWNSGGERTWLSPETEYHIRNLQSWAESYIVQKSVDPGSYHLRDNSAGKQPGNSTIWQQENTAEAFQTAVKVAFRLEKSCQLIDDPLRKSGLKDGLGGYSFVGYEANLAIEVLGSEKEPPLSLWTLMQVPAGGEIIIPTYGLVQPEYLYTDSSPSHVTIRKGEIRLRIDAEKFIKISLKGIHATGRMGYIRQGVNNEVSLLVRQIQIKPSELYHDVPLHNLADFGYCIQCYNDDGSNGAFGELEYHTPALHRDDGEAFLKDSSQIWCYSGPSETMIKIAEILLGV